MDSLSKPLLSLEQRRARREERRARQREANVGRAAKMHEARLAWQAEQDQLILVSRATEDSILPRLNIGCSGWFYWDWRRRFYPQDLPTKEWFSYYAEHFDTVELNAPFYSWPTIATVRSWERQARGRAFFYTIKVCELITHVKQFSRTATLVKDFGLIHGLVGSHMGCFLYQLPPSFHYSPARLKRILDQLDPAHRNVVEFRHRSWWNKQVTAAFRKTNTIFCACSAPSLPDELIQTSDEIYLRFHGTRRWYRHNYTPEELSVWARRILECNPRRVWAYFNNDYDGFAIDNSQELKAQLVDGGAAHA